MQLARRLLARTAAVLGKDADEARYAAYADNVLAAWRAEFIRADGTLTVDTQATHVRALAFGLVPPRLRKQTALRLVELIRAAGTHLGTGFLATPFLLPVLADTGHLDVAYELLFQDSVPSWLAMIDRGATTIWEDWDAIAADGTPKSSQNHYSKGAVISFLHRYVAGIRPRDDAPGYRHFDIHPQPGGGLTSAEAQLDCPYGRITSRWRIDHGTFHLTATVPPGTRATLTLPGRNHRRRRPGPAPLHLPGHVITGPPSRPGRVRTGLSWTARLLGVGALCGGEVLLTVSVPAGWCPKVGRPDRRIGPFGVPRPGPRPHRWHRRPRPRGRGTRRPGHRRCPAASYRPSGRSRRRRQSRPWSGRGGRRWCATTVPRARRPAWWR
ncbi:hypothetical protein HD596_008531 [Nonomuraea jabiensis]|uniref:alpha-L-rhamnosidase n=1 Tax=Nonomuraea jabiensis TaxID=882448 RepID=A0A7W9GDF8_9ACTN|nr:alpha-L-rhamnosidase C-terminal domain-containing protein [Nonomuraea jabiensis]MBB5781775.1 hypothetical protein [Nonomuraea jabiensis]